MVINRGGYPVIPTKSNDVLIAAARIEAWHIYQQQRDTRAFAVLHITTDSPVRNSIATGRRARVIYADGTIEERIIWANIRYIEVKGE